MTLACQILNFNNSTDTIKLVESIINYNVIDYILIVDNKSTDGSYNILAKKYSKLTKVRIIQTTSNRGYGAGNNYGIKFAYNNLRCELVLIANPDVSFSEQLVLKLVAAVKMNDDIAIASGAQRKQNSIVKDRAWKIPTKFEYIFSDTRLSKILNLNSEYHSNYFTNKYSFVDCVPGALFLVSSQKFLNVGGYDEDMFLYCEETTIGYKLKRVNYKTVLVNDAFYDHEQSSSINKAIPNIAKQRKYIYTNRIIFLRKYLHSSKITIYIAKKVYLHILNRLEKKR